MTIEVKGHIHSLVAIGGGSEVVDVTLHLESSRLPNEPHQVTIRAKPGEIDVYRVGMPIIVQVRPA